MRKNELRKSLNLAMALLLSCMLLFISCISASEGHSGLCHDLSARAKQSAGQHDHASCQHENSTCAESEDSRQHLHEILITQRDKPQTQAACHLVFTSFFVYPQTFSSRKPDTRPPEEPDRLRHHQSRVLLI